ncbi:MAG TPA: type II secretion system protein [Archangium sp.]|jgi:prepilin-type N-terminal cleavage/methylation domain-containing protein|uniref:pilus assembly FimT family protein n=1 Tax=Archangium sp. TaxID=1872627 RepID=UPI002ED8C94E
MKHRSRGFTLIELLVTVSILGLLTAVSVTALGPLRDRYNRRQAAELVASAASRAQLSARETGRCHFLEIHSTATGKPVKVTTVGKTGDRLRLMRRKTPDCEIDLKSKPGEDEVEEVEWVPLPGKTQVRVPKIMPEWRPNSRVREGETLLQVVAPSGKELAVRMMAHGPVCISEMTPLEDCP